MNSAWNTKIVELFHRLVFLRAKSLNCQLFEKNLEDNLFLKSCLKSFIAKSDIDKFVLIQRVIDRN